VTKKEIVKTISEEIGMTQLKTKEIVQSNPRTGQRVDVPEKFVVTFKPGKEMEEKVRELEQRLASQGVSLTADNAAKIASAPPTLENPTAGDQSGIPTM
jgi:hypothetical protein